MSNPFTQFLTPQISGKAVAGAQGPAMNNGQKAGVPGNAQQANELFLKMVRADLQGASDSGDTGKGGLPGEGMLSTLGLGTLSQEAAAQLAAQLNNGEKAGLLNLPKNLAALQGETGPFSSEQLFGLQAGGQAEAGAFSADTLINQVNKLLNNDQLKTENPALYNKLSAMQSAMNARIANGGQIQPGGDLKDLAVELNAMIVSGFDTQQVKAGMGPGGAIGDLRNELQSFLTKPPGEAEGLQKQFSPDLLKLLKGGPFATAQSRTKLFGAAANNGMGPQQNAMQALAVQMNGIEPGQGGQNTTNSFQQILQNIGHVLPGFGQSQNSAPFSGTPELSFTGGQQQAEANQQQALIANSSSLGLNSGAANAVQAPSASTPHPGTQMVAAQLARNAASGQARQMTLQLSPPELGRVHIQLELTRDNSLKARVTSEKAETHSMLQRDSQLLHKSLEEAGVDLDNGGLEFDLAEGEDGFNDFLKDNDGDLSKGSAGNNNADDGDPEALTHSTMTWHVDPDTGHARYNILA